MSTDPMERIWSIEEDQLVGNMGRYLAKKTPNCKAIFIPNGEHLWVMENMKEVVSNLVPPNELNDKGTKPT